MSKKRILIVEDHPIFRLGLTELINQEEDLEVCGSAMDVSEAWSEIKRLKPDLVIADITLRKSNGIDLVKAVNKQYASLPVLVLSMHDELLYAERAIHGGVRGYITKQDAMENVVTAVRAVLNNKIYLEDHVKDRILFGLTSGGPRDRSPVERLTDRELEVFRMIGQGFSTREIADRLHLSMKTIGTYRERIKEKLNLKHANELVRYAVHWAKFGRWIPDDTV